jgi:hypothetical protein
MKLGCIITNRRVKLRVWLGNARHHPWLRNSNINHRAGKIMLTFFFGGGGVMEGVILVLFTQKGPDLAPSNFYMFVPMKEALKGRRFSSDEEVIGAVQNLLKRQPKHFLTEIKNL